MSVIVSTKLTVDDYINLRKLCEQRGCSTYLIAKEAIKEYVISHSDKQSAPESKKEPIKQDLVKGDIEATPEPETLKIDAETVSEKVMNILKGETK